MGHTGNLSELQEQIARMLTRRGALDRDHEAIALANQHLTGSAHLSPVEQLEIYREQFWLRHTHALLEDFPGVGAILGQQAWESLSERYLSAHPPLSFTLRDLGEKLPDFVENDGSLPHQRLVMDMARLEWAYVDVFDAKDAVPLAVEELSRFGEEALAAARLRLAPGVRLLRLEYPVVELRKRILLAASHEEVALPAPEPAALVVYRADLAILHERLEHEPFTLLDALSRGKPLLAACESACALGPEATARVEAGIGEWLARWVQLKWIVGIEP